FSHPALIALALVLFAISGAALFAGGNLSPGVREDRSNRWVIIAFGPIGLALAYLPAYDDAGQLTSRIAFGLTDGRVGRSNERYISKCVTALVWRGSSRCARSGLQPRFTASQ